MIIKMFLSLIIITQISIALDVNNQTLEKQNESKNIWDEKNIWIKTYVNNRNYYTIINNIVKTEQKIKRNKNNIKTIESLNRKLDIYKSKLTLYERNKSFDRLLFPYKIDSLPEITAYDYLYKNSLNKMNKLVDKLVNMKNEFNKANSLLNNYFTKNKNASVSIDDIKYFEEFEENINKTYINLLEARDELNKKYEDYFHEKLQRHIITFATLVVAYIIYRFILLIYTGLEKRINSLNSNVYRKIITLIFYILVLLAVIIRYMEDFIYVITFLSVVAAALTIALREIILNIVASIYIFFSNMLRVGDRVMVQFETKHTIGDIQDISLMKIKLNEIEDYSNLKEVKNVGRTIYIPNSYVFTKVFYNYSRKQNGLINDLIEFEFTANNDFEHIEKITNDLLDEFGISHTITFTLNNLKTGVIGLISYQTHYKESSKTRGKISISLLQLYNSDETITLKTSKATPKPKVEEAE